MALPADPPPGPDDARLANLFRAYLDEEFRLHPVFATQQGDHGFDDRMDDLSREARARDVDRNRKLLATLEREIDPKKLSRNVQIDLEIWTHSLTYSLWSAANDN